MNAEEPSLIARIAARVDAWRGWPLGRASAPWSGPGLYRPVAAGERALSETSTILLAHWFRGAPHELPGGGAGEGGLLRFRYWPHQRRCVETLIYLHEVLGIRSVDALYDAFGVERTFRSQDPWAKLGGQLATGSGKTKIMSLAVVWSVLNALREGPGHLGLGPQALILAPGLFVKERLLFDFAPRDRPSVFRSDPAIPPILEPDWHLPVYGPDSVPQRLDPHEPALIVTNIHRLLRTEEPPPALPPDAPSSARQQCLLFETPEPKRLESEGTPLLSRLRRGAGLLVINDEAHHVGDEPAHQRFEKAAANRRAVGMGNGEENESMAWVRSLRTLHQQVGLGLQLDLSATLYEEEGGARQARSTKARIPRPFRHTAIDYPLREAIADGVVKHPVLERVRVTDTEGAELAPVRENQPHAWLKYEPLLRAGIGRWQRVRDQLKAEGDARKPILFLLCADRHEAQEIANFLTYGEASREDLSATRSVCGWIDPNTQERLFVEPDPDGNPRSTVIQIHIGSKEEKNEQEWQKVRAAVNAVDHDEIADPGGALDERGAVRRLPNPYNVVVSVMMLKEGWDVRNVKVIVPLRSCDSRTLTEQTLGRGLRRMHQAEMDEDGAVQAPKEELYVMQHPSFDAIIEEIKDIVEVRDPDETDHTPEYVRIEPLESLDERMERDVRFVYFLGERERERDWRADLRVADTALADRLPWVESFQDREVKTYLREALAEEDADGQRFTLSAAPSFRDYDQVMEVAYALPLLRDIQAAYSHKNAVKGVVREQLERQTFKLPMGLPLSFDRAIEAGPSIGRIALCNLLRPEVIARVRDALRAPLREAIAGRPTERVASLKELRAADLAAYPARKQHELERAERSVFRNGAFDSADELRFAVLADRCPDVTGWLYNHRQGVGLRIEYDWQGHLAQYYPDFILRVRWGERFHNLIAEVKGRMDERDLAKARAGRRYAGVLATHDSEPWHYLLVQEDPKVGRIDLSWLDELATPSMGALLRHLERQDADAGGGG